MNLHQLGHRYGTDKATIHRYTQIYERYLAPLRAQPLTLLELGVGGYGDPHAGGESLRMWRDYFPRAQIVGVDHQPKQLGIPTRVHIYCGSQDDPDLFERIIERHGPPSIVIDDASHHTKLTVASFEILWPRLASDGGLYIVEDTCCSYHPDYGGHPDPDRNPLMRFFERLADDANHHTTWAGHDTNYPAAFWRGYDPAFVHFWRQLVIIGK